MKPRLIAAPSAVVSALPACAGPAWGARTLDGLPDIAEFFPDDPVDCDDPDRCSRPGYNAWRFFELLAEREGPEFVRALYDRSRALGARDHQAHLIDALEAELASRSTTLTE